MKVIMFILLIFVCSMASIYAISEPMEKAQSTQELPEPLLQLAIKIENMGTIPNERNQRLRFERAQHYYQSAKLNLARNWHKQAVADANRGLKLLAMNAL